MEPAVLFGGAAVAAAFVVLLVVTLLFSRKTVSFEEAVLQPRKLQHAAAARPKKVEARKEKKSDNKKKTGKKCDEDEVDRQSATVTTAVTVTPDQHVDFKVANEVVPLDEEHEQQLAKRQVHADERPKKPILTKRNDCEPPADSHTQIDRCNSFEVVHPKDEYELIKSQQTRDQQQAVSGDDDVRTKVRDGKKKPVKSPKAIPAEKLTVAQLMDMVKSVALTEEESQLVVNEILNTESESWSQKNDPLAQLKKSVQEKEAQLRTEAENREALKVRVHELRQELAAQKVQAQTVRSQCQQLQQELLKSQAGLRAAVEQHRADQQALQLKVRNECSAKAAAGLSRLQDENVRLKELVQKLELDRAALDAIPRLQKEAEQLRNDRQQKEVAISHLKQQHEELVRENNVLKEQLNSLTSSRQQDEFAAKQQIAELQTTVRDRESAAQTVAEELRLVRERLSQVTRDWEHQADDLTRTGAESRRVSDDNSRLLSQVAESEQLLHQQRIRLQQVEEELSEVRSAFESETAAAAGKLQSLEQECRDLQKRNSGSDGSEKLSEAEQRIALLSQEKDVLNDQLSEQKRLVADLQQEKDSIRHSLTSSSIHSDLSQQSLAQAVNAAIQNQRSELNQSRQELDEQRSRNEQLQREVATFTQSLKQTDESLKEIESRAVEQAERWNEELGAEREQRTRVGQENATLAEENQSLQQTIKELQSIQTTVVDMEDKLKDLQSKLRGEEVAKRDLSGKFDEVSSADVREASSHVLTMREELDRATRQLLDLSQERLDADELKQQVDELQAQLEREKKSAKELQMQNVKLRSLVKIGEDSLRAEMQRTDELLNQLKLRNGSAVSTPCLTTNGNDQDSVLSSISSSSLNREGSNGN